MILTYYDKLKNSMCYLNIEKNKVTQFDISSLPKIFGDTNDGVTYIPTSEDLNITAPTMSDMNSQHSYNQIVFIPKAPNETNEPLLVINNKSVPIRVRPRVFYEESVVTTSLLSKTAHLQPHALIKDMPYILTFCDECWVIDSYVAQFEQSDANTLSYYANILAKLIDEEKIGFPIIDTSQAMSMSKAYISTADTEVAEQSNIVIPTIEKVEEMIRKNITADLNNATQENAWLGLDDETTKQYITLLPDGKYIYNEYTYSIIYIDILTLPSKYKWVKIQHYTDDAFLRLDIYFKNIYDSDYYCMVSFSNEKVTLAFPQYGVEFWNTDKFPKPTNLDIGKVPVAGQDGYVGWENIATPAPYTTLSRKGVYVSIHCHNLNPNKSYKLYLYTVSRHGGNKKGNWYHPANYDAAPKDGVSDHRMGYRKLAGKPIDASGSVFPDVPEWMPNNGFLQTEWPIPANSSNHLEIYMGTWLIPMLKPTGRTAWIKEPAYDGKDLISARLIGINNRNVAGLLFRFCLVDNDGAIYECKDTLRVGGKRWCGDDWYPTRLFMGENNFELFRSYIYTSII